MTSKNHFKNWAESALASMRDRANLAMSIRANSDRTYAQILNHIGEEK